LSSKKPREGQEKRPLGVHERRSCEDAGPGS
jgi:hypothetical protein